MSLFDLMSPVRQLQRSGALRGAGHSYAGTKEMKCVICGERYGRCECTCTWCGTPKWSRDDEKGGWKHHVCSGRSK